MSNFLNLIIFLSVTLHMMRLASDSGTLSFVCEVRWVTVFIVKVTKRMCRFVVNIKMQFIIYHFNPIEDGSFWECSRMGEGKKVPHPKIWLTYTTMMKLGTFIPYLEKIQIYKSPDTPLEFCWHQHFFTRKQQILLYQEIQIQISF